MGMSVLHCMYMYHMHACLVLEEVRRGQTVVSCHVCGCWEINLGPLWEQQMLQTPEPSLQLPI